MATIVNVHGGDFVPGSIGTFSSGVLKLKTLEHPFLGETIPVQRIVDVEIVAQEGVGRPGAAVGRAIVGSVLLGPIGALAGAATTKQRTDITFAASFQD